MITFVASGNAMFSGVSIAFEITHTPRHHTVVLLQYPSRCREF
jgi:hypothetical protein